MVDNFEIQKTNYLLILENDPDKNDIFYKLIRFLNEHSIVNYSLTTNVKLNVDLRFVHTTAEDSSNATQLGFECTFADQIVRILEDDLKEYFHLPRDNFDNLSTKGELHIFFRAINCTLENGNVPGKLYKHHLPRNEICFSTLFLIHCLQR